MDNQQLKDDLEDLREDTTHLAMALQSYGQVLASVVRVLEANGMPLDGIKLPTTH